MAIRELTEAQSISYKRFKKKKNKEKKVPKSPDFKEKISEIAII